MQLSRDRPDASFHGSKTLADRRVGGHGVVRVRRALPRPQHGDCVVSKVEVITDGNGQKQTKPTQRGNMHATHTHKHTTTYSTH